MGKEDRKFKRNANTVIKELEIAIQKLKENPRQNIILSIMEMESGDVANTILGFDKEQLEILFGAIISSYPPHDNKSKISH